MKQNIFNFDKEIFKDVSKMDAGVIYSWTWNSEITEELIDRQLVEIKEQGVRGIYILPEPKEFRPNHMATRLSPDYLTDEYFSMVKYAVEKAKMMDISVWLYDEGGWPSGGACGQIVKKYPDATAKYIKEELIAVKKGETIDEKDKLAVFSKDLKRITLPYTAENDEEVYVYAERFHDTIYTYVLDDRVMDEFIECTYEGYKKHLGNLFGNYVSAIFTDEPNVSFPYCIDENDFENKSGYSLRDNLPAIFHNGISEEADKFKTCYIEYCGEQFKEKYVKRLKDWCADNNIIFTGHMSGEDILGNFWHCTGNPMKLLRNMDIPGVDAIWRQIFPGGKENNFFPRTASSAAHQTGGRFAVSESFAAYGNGVTFDEMRYVANYQFVRGINILNVMSMTTGRDNFLFGQLRPHFVKELPTYKYMKSFNDYLTRMMYVCSIGEYTAETAIYMPIRDMWIGKDEADEKYLKMGKELEENQVNFDIIDDDFLIDCELCDGCLCMGDAKYRYIYIPQCDNMSDEAKDKLENFIEIGGHVFGNDLNIKNIKDYNADNILADRVIKTNNKNIRALKKKTENETIYIIFNEAENEIFAEIEVAEKSLGYRLNVETGEITKQDSNSFNVKLESGEAYVMIYTNDLLTEERQKETDRELCLRINDFKITPIEKLSVKGGKLCVCNENITIDDEFSGSAIYKCEFAFDKSCDIIIEFEKLYYYARVFVNSNEIGTVLMNPKEIRVDRKYLADKNELEIVVTNTAANAFYHADFSGVEEKYIGPYNEQTMAFEKDSLKFGLSEIRIYKER